MVPVYYLGVVAVAWASPAIQLPRVQQTVAVGSLAILLGFNLVETRRVFRMLSDTGGIGLASDAITRFEEDSLSEARRTFFVFPDWGIDYSFVMTTRGEAARIIEFDAATMRRNLCAGKDVVLAYFPDAEGDHRKAMWVQKLGRGQPQEKGYKQRDQFEVLRVLRWRAGSDQSIACSDEKKSALWITSSALAAGVNFAVTPESMRECDPPTVATLTWNVATAGVQNVKIFVVNKADGAEKLFAESGSSGTVETGPWVSAGAPSF